MVSDIRSGDIILWSSKQPTSGWSKLVYKLQNRYDGDARHAEIVYDYDGRTGMIKCYGSNFDDVKFRAHIVDKPYVCIVRPKEDISWVSNGVVNEVKESLETNGKIKYDFAGMINASVNAFLSKITFGLYEKKRIFSESDVFYCSELAVFITQKSYRKIGKQLSITDSMGREIETVVVSPSDIYRNAKENKAFEIIKDFEL